MGGGGEGGRGLSFLMIPTQERLELGSNMASLYLYAFNYISYRLPHEIPGGGRGRLSHILKSRNLQ